MTTVLRTKIELIDGDSIEDCLEDIKNTCSDFISDVEVLDYIEEEEYTTLWCKVTLSDDDRSYYDVITQSTTVADTDILEIYD